MDGQILLDKINFTKLVGHGHAAACHMRQPVHVLGMIAAGLVIGGGAAGLQHAGVSEAIVLHMHGEEAVGQLAALVRVVHDFEVAQAARSVDADGARADAAQGERRVPVLGGKNRKQQTK